MDRLRDAAKTLRGGKREKLAICVDALFPAPALVRLAHRMQEAFPGLELRVEVAPDRALAPRKSPAFMPFLGRRPAHLRGRWVTSRGPGLSKERDRFRLLRMTNVMNIRRANERGHAEHGWLDSHHTFSFADYHDPKHMGFRALRVINEDRVAAGEGFPTHGHREMEIISYVLEGALEHKDSIGTVGVIKPGDVQRMSAGTGVRHSEYNQSRDEGVHFLQIWIMPDKAGHAPGYEQKAFPDDEKRGKLRLVASPTGANGSVSIHQDARLYAGLFKTGESATYELKPMRGAWVHVAKGAVKVNGTQLVAGDAAKIEAAGAIEIEGVEESGEVLLFDLA